MPTERDFLGLIDTIYETVHSIDDWPRVLNAIDETFASRSSHLVYVPDPTKEVLLNKVSVSVDPRAAAEYVRDYLPIDTRVKEFPKHMGKVVRCVDLVPVEEFEKSPLIGFLDRPDLQVRWCIAAPFRIGPGSFGYVSMMRPRRRGPYTREETKVLETLAPHVRRVLELQLRLGELSGKACASESALNHVASGVVLTDADARIAFVNEAAERIFRGENGVSAPGRRLCCRHAHETAALRATIARISTSQTAGAETTNVITVARPGGKAALVAIVLPIPWEHRIATLVRRASAAVFLIDPEEKPLPPLELLRELGFTPAESRLALELVRGETLDTIADRLAVGKATLRTQLLHLFRKTGTSRQTDLVSFIDRCFSLRLGSATAPAERAPG